MNLILNVLTLTVNYLPVKVSLKVSLRLSAGKFPAIPATPRVLYSPELLAVVKSKLKLMSPNTGAQPEAIFKVLPVPVTFVFVEAKAASLVVRKEF